MGYKDLPETETVDEHGIQERIDGVHEITCESDGEEVDTCVVDGRRIDLDEVIVEGSFATSPAFVTDGSHGMAYEDWNPNFGSRFHPDRHGGVCFLLGIDTEYQDKDVLYCAKSESDILLENVEGGSDEKIYEDAHEMGIQGY